MIKYIRRTPAELKTFRVVVNYYTSLGYSVHDAESRAWDMLFAARRGRKNKLTYPEVSMK